MADPWAILDTPATDPWSVLDFTDAERQRAQRNIEQGRKLLERIDRNPSAVVFDELAKPEDRLTAAMESMRRRGADFKANRTQYEGDLPARSLDPLYYPKKLPFVGAALQARESLDFVNSLTNVKQGTAKSQDYLDVARYMAMLEAQGDYSTLQSVTDGVLGSASFAAELATTFGVSTALRTLTEGVVTKGLTQAGVKAASKAALTRGAGVAAELAGQVAANPQRSAANITGRMAQGEDTLGAVGRGIADTAVEYASEMSGRGIARLLPGKGLNPRAGGALARAGVQGLPTEFAEERLADVARGVTGLAPDYGATGEAVQGNFKPLAEELAVLGVLQGAGSTINLQDIRQRRAQLAALQDQRGLNAQERAAAAAMLADFDAAAVWSAENPEAANRIAAIEAPSRSQWREATGFRIDGNPEQRKAFAANVRSALEQRTPADYGAGEINDAGVRLDNDRTRRAPPAPPQAEPAGIPVEGATVPAFPTEQLSSEWRQIDPTQPLPQSGIEVFRDKFGQTFVRTAGGSAPQNAPMDSTSGANDRRTALEAMSIGEVNQEASRFGIKKGPKKAKMIEKILAAEAQRPAPQPTQQPTPMSQAAPQPDAVQTPQLDMRLKNPQPVETPSVPQDATEAPTASILPPDLAAMSDDDLGAFLTVLGDKPPVKNPPKTYRARLESKVAAIVGRASTTPVQRAPAPSQPQETPNAVQQEEKGRQEGLLAQPTELQPKDEAPTPAPVVEKPARVVGEDRKKVARQGLAANFPGSKISDVAATREHDGGYRVELPNGRFFEALFLPEIKADPAAVAQSLRGKLGREPTPEEIDSVRAAGAFFRTTTDGRVMPGLGAMALATGMFDDSTIRHEGLHLARSAGLFTDAEWKALADKYAPGATSEQDIEEGIAYSTEAWKEPTIAERIKALFQMLLKALGITPDARMVEVLMQSPEFWSRNETVAPPQAAPVEAPAAPPADEGFALDRTPPPAPKAKETQPKETQGKLLTGMDLLPGQQDLLPNMNKQGKIEGEDYPEGWTWKDFKTLLEEIRDRINQENSEHNMAIEELVGGKDAHETAMRLRKIRNHRDRGGDADGMKYFDELMQRVRDNHPALLRGPDLSEESNVIDNLAEGRRPTLTINSEDVQAEAWSYARYMAQNKQEGGSEFLAPSDAPFQLKPRANIGETPEVRRMVAEQEATAERPETRPDDDVFREAGERLAKNGYAAERERLIKVAETPGGQLSDTETIVARRIFNADAQEALASGDQQKVLAAIKVLEAYRRTGTEQGRAFRLRRDFEETPDQQRRRTLSEAVLSPPQKDQAAIDAALKDGNKDEAERLRKKWAKEFEQLKKKLLLLGVDLDNLAPYGYDPVKAARAISTVSAAKADAWDKAYEYWRNAILSGMQTQVANFGGTLLHGAELFMVKRPLEAAINLLIGRPEGAQLGEFRHVAQGIVPGLARGVRNALIAFRTEMPELERQLDRDGQFRLDDPNVAIEGSKGRFIRIPQRLMLAADDMMKSIFATMDVGAQAYRQAKGLGLKGEELRKFITEQVNDLTSTSWARAHDTSLELAFQQRGTKAAQAVKKGLLTARREFEVLGIKPLAFIFPFVTTPVNIFETGMRRAPITGDIAALKKMWNNYRAGRPTLQDMTPRLAERVIAWSVVAALAAMTGGDDDEPWITGTISSKDRGQRDLSRRTFPAQSIKLNGRWYSYSRIEPLATALALTVDWINAGKKSLKTGDATGIAAAPFTSILQQLKDKTFLDGIGDIMRIAEAPNPVEGVADWAANHVVSWVPNIIRSTSRATSDTFPERGVWGDGSDKMKRLGKRILQRTELGLVRDQPSVDIWGREAKRGTSPVYGTDIPWRIVSPVDSRVPELFVGDRVLLNWNAQHPGSEEYPVMPNRKFKVGGVERSLSDEEYTQYLRLSGGIARTLVERLKVNAEKPTEDDLKAVTGAITEGRSRAREALSEQWTKGTRAPEAAALAQVAFEADIAQRADVLARVPPLKPSERKKWVEERAAAMNWLKSKGVKKEDVLNAYKADLAQIKTPATRFAKRGRLSRALGSL